MGRAGFRETLGGRRKEGGGLLLGFLDGGKKWMDWFG